MSTEVNLANDVELSVNVCARDVGFFEPTYRHLIKGLRYPFKTRRLIVDRSVPTGRFATSDLNEQTFDQALQSLVDDGLVDVIDEVDWSEDVVQRVMRKFFGRATAPTRCAAGSPIYQYLFAIEQATSPYLLHFDNDILVHMRDGCTWIDHAIELMRSNERVVFATPEGGPAQATGAMGWVFGRRARTDRRWQRAASVSTRYFLLDRDRFNAAVLPLVVDRAGETLERTITASVHRQGLERQSIADDFNWVIHPRRHNRNHIDNLPELIQLVESNKAPFRRTGYRWDLRTEGRHFLPWLLAIKRQQLLSGRLLPQQRINR